MIRSPVRFAVRCRVRRRGRALAIPFAALCVALLAGCANGYVPLAARLDAVDRAEIVRVTQAALENNRIGEASNWANAASGHRGTVTPTSTYRAQSGTAKSGTANTGRPCRSFQQTAAIDGRTLIAYDSACRGDGGAWRSLDHAGLDGAIVDARPIRQSYGYRHYEYPYYGYPGYGYPGYRYPSYRYPGYGYRPYYRRHGPTFGRYYGRRY